METYYRGEAEPMPYNTNGTLRVREFRGTSKSNILWTTKRTMQSWNRQQKEQCRVLTQQGIYLEHQFQ